jgi:hypothetical protein
MSSDYPFGVPKRASNGAKKPIGERWVPVEGKPYLYRDANSHADPAHQRMKYVPPDPTSPFTFPWPFLTPTKTP